MTKKSQYLAVAFAAVGVCVATLTAPVASAAPECKQVSPRTTLCQRSGSAQLTTTPDRVSANPWPFYGFGFGFGGGGIVIGG